MSAALREYLLSLAGCGMLLTLVLTVLRPGTIRTITGIMGGLLMILAAVSPVVKLDPDSIAETIWSMQVDGEELRNGVEFGSRELLSQVIRERCAAYILDKAAAMGVNLEVNITLEETGDLPYPIAVTITGNWSPSEQKALQDYISGELGIPRERQEWIVM